MKKFDEAVKKILVEGPKDKLIKYGVKAFSKKNKGKDVDYYDIIDKKVSEVYDYLAMKDYPTTGKFFDDLIKTIVDAIISKGEDGAYKEVEKFADKNKVEYPSEFADDILVAWYI